MTIVDQAVRLGRAGYHVGPCSIVLDEKGKKRPTFPRQWQTAREEADIRALFDGTGATGIFCDTEKTGIVVVDVDRKGDVDGLANLRAAGMPQPDTNFAQVTWSGGEHWFFRQPDNPLPSVAGKPVPGVDIRGLRGVVFMSGTTVTDSEGVVVGSYSPKPHGQKVADLPTLPAEFASAVLSSMRRVETPSSGLVAYTGHLSPHQEEVLSRWLEEDLDAIRAAGDGERQQALSTNVVKVVDRASKLGYEVEDIRQLVREAYVASGGNEWEEDKAALVDWAIDRVNEEPMGVPEDWIDPDEVRFEEAVKEQLTKIRVREEAKRRAALDTEEVDLGRELDFTESSDGLHGKYWVDKVLPMGETVLIFGERNVGKSFVAVDLGLSVASGRPWHGYNTTVGNVLYLAGEGAIGLPSRRRAWVQHHRTENPTRFRLRDRIVHLNNPRSMEAWQKIIVDQEIDLVIVDTLRRAARGRELENPGDVQEVVELVDDLRSVRHGCTALLLGHPTKSDPTQPAGAGTLQDALPMIHRLTQEGEGEATEVVMVTTKNKDGARGHLHTFGMKPTGESLVLVPVQGVHSW